MMELGEVEEKGWGGEETGREDEDGVWREGGWEKACLGKRWPGAVNDTSHT